MGGGGERVRAMAEEADPEPGTLATNSLSLQVSYWTREERIDRRKTYYEAENGIVD